MSFREKTLHIALGYTCNNNCIFCMESREGRFATVKNVSVQDHKQTLLYSSKLFDRVVFTTGEPTLNKDLHELIAYAKELRYKEIYIVTNGRRLSSGKYFNSLIERGLNGVSISIHAHNPELHDKLTRTKDSFDQTVRGLKNAMELRRARKLKSFNINTTLTKLNYDNIDKMYRFFIEFNPDLIVMNFFSPKADAKSKSKLLMPKYSDVVDNLRQLYKDDDKRFLLVDFPPCTLKDMLSQLGSIEDYHINTENSGLSDETGYGDYYTEDIRGSRPSNDKCRVCIMNTRCHGFPKEYIDLYGDEEIKPIEDNNH